MFSSLHFLHIWKDAFLQINSSPPSLRRFTTLRKWKKQNIECVFTAQHMLVKNLLYMHDKHLTFFCSSFFANFSGCWYCGWVHCNLKHRKEHKELNESTIILFTLPAAQRLGLLKVCIQNSLIFSYSYHFTYKMQVQLS